MVSRSNKETHGETVVATRSITMIDAARCEVLFSLQWQPISTLVAACMLDFGLSLCIDVQFTSEIFSSSLLSPADKSNYQNIRNW